MSTRDSALVSTTGLLRTRAINAVKIQIHWYIYDVLALIDDYCGL